jgi:hypothetical protein
MEESMRRMLGLPAELALPAARGQTEMTLPELLSCV